MVTMRRLVEPLPPQGAPRLFGPWIERRAIGMSGIKAPSIGSSDLLVEHPQGRIFARVWTPSSGMSTPVPEGPIVLFHDSLGCVDLWRDFPADLCTMTG